MKVILDYTSKSDMCFKEDSRRIQEYWEFRNRDMGEGVIIGE